MKKLGFSLLVTVSTMILLCGGSSAQAADPACNFSGIADEFYERFGPIEARDIEKWSRQARGDSYIAPADRALMRGLTRENSNTFTRLLDPEYPFMDLEGFEGLMTVGANRNNGLKHALMNRDDTFLLRYLTPQIREYASGANGRKSASFAEIMFLLDNAGLTHNYAQPLQGGGSRLYIPLDNYTKKMSEGYAERNGGFLEMYFSRQKALQVSDSIAEIYLDETIPIVDLRRRIGSISADESLPEALLPPGYVREVMYNPHLAQPEVSCGSTLQMQAREVREGERFGFKGFGGKMRYYKTTSIEVDGKVYSPTAIKRHLEYTKFGKVRKNSPESKWRYERWAKWIFGKPPL